MKEISLKRPKEKSTGEIPMEASRESYPTFSVYDKAPKDLMDCDMGCEMMAKVKMTSKTKHEGTDTRDSVGFDVLSIMLEGEDSPREKGKKIIKGLVGDKD